jgi:hypothetical protein
MVIRRVTGLFAAAAMAVLAGQALAQQPTQAQANAIRQACRADYQSHCASVPTGGSAAVACLQQNAASLSSPCQQALAAVSGGAPSTGQGTAVAPRPATPQMSPREEVAMLRASCRADYRAHCSDVEPGGGRAIACLHAHEQQLSKQCRSALLAARHAH